MGSSKIVMLSGVYLILGMYTLSFSIADRSNSKSVEAVANTIQSEQLALSGISLAMQKMGSNSNLDQFASTQSSMTSGTVTYSAAEIVNQKQSEITSTATFSGKTITAKATFNYYNGRWRVARVYITPTAETLTY